MAKINFLRQWALPFVRVVGRFVITKKKNQNTNQPQRRPGRRPDELARTRTRHPIPFFKSPPAAAAPPPLFFLLCAAALVLW